MLTNEPLKYCFDQTAGLALNALSYISKTCAAVDALTGNPDAAAIVDVELDALSGRVGDYFAAGISPGEVQRVFAPVVDSLNAIARASMLAASGFALPPSPPYTFKHSAALNVTQTDLLNTCVEFVRVHISAAIWLLSLRNREKYESETRAFTAELKLSPGDVQPLTADDERQAAELAGELFAHFETIRAQLKISDFPTMEDGRQANKLLLVLNSPLLRIFALPFIKSDATA